MYEQDTSDGLQSCMSIGYDLNILNYEPSPLLFQLFFSTFHTLRKSYRHLDTKSIRICVDPVSELFSIYPASEHNRDPSTADTTWPNSSQQAHERQASIIHYIHLINGSLAGETNQLIASLQVLHDLIHERGLTDWRIVAQSADSDSAAAAAIYGRANADRFDESRALRKRKPFIRNGESAASAPPPVDEEAESNAATWCCFLVLATSSSGGQLSIQRCVVVAIALLDAWVASFHYDCCCVGVQIGGDGADCGRERAGWTAALRAHVPLPYGRGERQVRCTGICVHTMEPHSVINACSCVWYPHDAQLLPPRLRPCAVHQDGEQYIAFKCLTVDAYRILFRNNIQ